MALGKGAAGAGFQVLFEADGFRFRSEFYRYHDRPRAVLHGVAARSVVVPLESLVDVARCPNVVPRWIAIATKRCRRIAFRFRARYGSGKFQTCGKTQGISRWAVSAAQFLQCDLGVRIAEWSAFAASPLRRDRLCVCRDALRLGQPSAASAPTCLPRRSSAKPSEGKVRMVVRLSSRERARATARQPSRNGHSRPLGDLAELRLGLPSRSSPKASEGWLGGRESQPRCLENLENAPIFGERV